MARKKLKKGGVGQKQAGRVMEEYYAGKLRRPGGAPITSPRVARAVAMSEGRAAESRGVGLRAYMGRTRMRPHKKKRGRRAA